MVETIKIQNKNTSEFLEMDKLNTEDYILDYVDWGQASVDQFTQKHINQVGVTILKVSYKSRNIEISGFIIADTEEEMTERKKYLNGFVNPQNEYYAIYKRYQIMFMPTMSVRYTNTEETNNNEVICRFKITGVCPYPLFSLADDIVLPVGKYISGFHFPYHINVGSYITFGVKAEGEYRKRNVRNEGSSAVGFKFQFKAINGNVSNPTLYNFTTGEEFKILKELTPGEVVKVDTIVGEKTVMGGTSEPYTNYIQYMDINSDWLTLAVGDNIIGYSVDAGLANLEITMDISLRFLEVQECF